MSSVNSPQIIVLFVIIGAAGAVTIAYAIARFFIKQDDRPLNPHDVPPEQAQYMRDVRERERNRAWEVAYGPPIDRAGKAERMVGPRVSGSGSGEVSG